MWPVADIRGARGDVRFLELSGLGPDGAVRSVFDPGCVKTREIETRRELHSSIRS